MSIRTAILSAAVVVALPMAGAAATVVPSYENGWVLSNGRASDANTNTYTGITSSREYRSYYLFDISSFAGETVETAKLIFRGGNGNFVSNGTSTTATIYDVSQSSIPMLDNATSGPSGFADLGSGSSYGTITASGSTTSFSMPELSVELNAAGIADLNAAITSGADSFGFGAAVTSSTGTRAILWSSSSGLSAASLEIEVAPEVVPLPASVLMLGAGIAGLGGLGAMRRRKKA